MKQKLQRFVKNLLKVTAVACFLSSTALLNAQSITVVNGDFQDATAKQTNWESVNGWNSDTPALDSGVEERFGPTIWTAFIKSTDPAVWNLTDHPVAEGEIYTLTLGWAWDIWATNSGFSVRLFYSNDAGLTRTTLGTAYTGSAYDGLQVIADGIAAPAGSMLGIEIDNIAGGDAWAGFDNVTLTYSTLSSNANLASIGLSVGEFTQTLSPGVTDYFVTVPPGTLSVDVFPTAEDGAAVITTTPAYSPVTITGGVGSTTIEVTAEDGTIKNYNLFFKELTLMHAYDFEGDLEDGIGSAHGTAQGSATVSGGALVLDDEGDYVTFDPALLDLNSYDGVCLEFFYTAPQDVNTGHWNYSFYFGDDNGVDAYRGTLGFWNDEIWANNSGTELGIQGLITDNCNVHHVVMNLTNYGMSIYLDGALAGSRSNSGFTIGTTNAMLGNGFWPDPTWKGHIFEFNIYDGAMGPDEIATKAISTTFNSNVKLGSLTVDVGQVVPALDCNLDAYTVIVPAGTPSVDISATPEDVGPGASIIGTGEVFLVGGEATANLEVTSANGLFKKIYTVNIIEGCFAPTMGLTNLVSNPSFAGNWASLAPQITKIEWGGMPDPKSTEDACGDSTGSVFVKGGCWPDGGVIEFNSGVPIVPGYHYRILAKVKNETAAIDAFNLILQNSIWNLADNDNSDQDQNLVAIPTGAGWVQFDQTITAGSAATGNVSFSFHNCDGFVGATSADLLYIDHLEVYIVPTLSVKDFEARSFSLYPNPSNSGDFTIQLKSANVNGSVNVKVYSLLGKEILNQDFTPSAGKIDINQDLNSGLYLVKIDNKETTKLVVK